MLVPPDVAPELAEANARMCPAALAILDGRDAARIAAVREAHVDGLVLIPNADDTDTRLNQNTMRRGGSNRRSAPLQLCSGFRGVWFLDTQQRCELKRRASPFASSVTQQRLLLDMHRRHQAEGNGEWKCFIIPAPLDQARAEYPHLQFGTPEEAALALARQRPSPSVDPDLIHRPAAATATEAASAGGLKLKRSTVANAYAGKATSTGYVGVTRYPNGSARRGTKRYRVSLPHSVVLATGRKRDQGRYGSAELGALAYLRALVPLPGHKPPLQQRKDR